MRSDTISLTPGCRAWAQARNSELHEGLVVAALNAFSRLRYCADLSVVRTWHIYSRGCPCCRTGIESAMNATIEESQRCQPVLAAGGENSGSPWRKAAGRYRPSVAGTTLEFSPRASSKARREADLAAAEGVRAMEETGVEVRVHEFLGVISYVGGSGRRLRISGACRRSAPRSALALGLDIKAVEWLPLSTAIEQLNLAARASRSCAAMSEEESHQAHAEEPRRKPVAEAIARTPPTSHRCRTIFPWAPL